ncbi:MAG: hypothetical protein WBA74_24085 [Cyclobacteriaceae bacterium]
MKNWSYKKKNIALAITIVVLLIVGYFLSFSKTLELTRENEQLRSDEDSGTNLPLRIASVNRNIQKLDSLILLNEESYQARLLGTLSKYCQKHKTTLLEVKDVEFSQYENAPYETYSIKMEGKYTDLIRTMSDMENNYGLGKIQSVNFATETERKSKKVSLVLQLYLTRVIIKNSKNQ